MTKSPLNPPFRADQVGSLLRPQALLAARAEHDAGRLSAEELRAVEDESIRNSVAAQEALGLKVVTDGEYRRAGYFADFFERGLGNFRRGAGEGSGAEYVDATGARRGASLAAVSGRLKWTAPIHADEFRFLASVATVTPKITLPSPTIPHYFGGRANIDREAYPNLDLLWADLIDAFRKELASLYDAGCRYVQIDETALAKFGDPKIQAGLARRGEDWRDLLVLYPQVINACIEQVPADMHIALHSCRGNNQGAWQAEGGYDAAADALFNGINVQSYFLEYDTPRAGDFSPLRLVPKSKSVVLGLVSTKSATLETQDDILRRIDEAARFIDRDQLCLSPQCGFASDAKGNPVTQADEAAKLRLVIETAARAWR